MAVRYGPVWTRRAVLVAAGGAGVAGVLSGCSLFESEQPAPPPDPLEPLLVSTHALVARYQDEITAHPALAPRLQPIQQTHQAHTEALRELIGRPPADRSADDAALPSSATGAPDDPTGPDDPADPDDPVAVLAALAEVERTAEHEARLACLSAPPGRTGLLGSITAARATHAEVLTWSE